MPLTSATLATKYRMLPNQQTVVLSRDGQTVATVNGCVRRPLDFSAIEFVSGMGVTQELTSFLMPNANMSGETPNDGDTLTDAESIDWTVLRSMRELEGAMWRVFCVKQR